MTLKSWLAGAAVAGATLTAAPAAAASTQAVSHASPGPTVQVHGMRAAAIRAAQASHGTGQVATIRPPGREWASLAYDPALHQLVLFGGYDGAVLGDTWTRHGTTWTQQHPASAPSARTGAAIVYDAATHQLLLFGGSSQAFFGGGTFFGSTWVWTGTTWRRLHPAASPPGRHNGDLVYDAARKEVILFGGYDGSYLGDTWAWTGTTWTQLHPAISPSPRDSDSLAYDAASQAAILYGGYGDTGRLSDTWSWNGTTWTQLTPATSPGVVTTAWQAAYDAASQQVVLFGGDPGGGQPLDGTWAWTGTTWTQLTPALSPPGRVYGSMTYNSTSQRIMLFGGSTNGTETTFPATTWTWDGTTWSHAG